VISRLREDRGQASAELMGMLWWMFLCALVIWQLMLAAWATDQAKNAARTASRVAGRGGDGEKAAKNAVSAGLRHDMDAASSGEQWKVSVIIPILIPGLGSEKLRAHGEATLPNTANPSF
jgi:hypothetical protein